MKNNKNEDTKLDIDFTKIAKEKLKTNKKDKVDKKDNTKQIKIKSCFNCQHIQNAGKQRLCDIGLAQLINTDEELANEIANKCKEYIQS